MDLGGLVVLDRDGMQKVADHIGFDPRHVDPFFRLITANPSQIGSMDFRQGKHPQYMDEALVGGGTATHIPARSSIDMTVGTANGDRVLRRTYRSFDYRRGNSQTVFMSMIIGAGRSNVNIEQGYFDDNNGCFIRNRDGALYFVIRSGASGAVVDTAIAQADWNWDRLDGSLGATNRSGVTLDPSKQNVMFIEFSGLGANVVVFGFIINGVKIICHVQNNANIITRPWATTAMLPISSLIENVGATAGSTTTTLTCFAVFSNGSVEKENPVKSISSGVTALNVNTTATAIAGIRIRPDIRNVGVQAISYDITPTSGNSFLYYRVIQRGTIAGGGTWTNFNDILQVLTAPAVYTEATGYILDQGHLSTSNQNRNRSEIVTKSDIFLGHSINGTPDNLLLVAQTTTSTATIHFDGFFREIL